MAQAEYWPRYGLENYSYTFSVEETFDPKASTEWMQNNWVHSFTLSVLYVILIQLGKKFMKSRKAFELDNALFCWNMGLAVFSFMGILRMAPEMFWSINSNSLIYSICTASYAQGVTGYWTEKFAMSKVFELIDTAFIILRKRPLIFLHWYHHITVLVYTWHAFKDHTASGRWFILMNYTVHTFMYAYYALRSIRVRVPKWAAMLVTFLQIAQMVVGVSIGVSIYFIKRAGGECQQTWSNLYFSFLIYFSYLLLFCNFFYNAYLKRGGKSKTSNANGVSKNGVCTNAINGSLVMETHEIESEYQKSKLHYPYDNLVTSTNGSVLNGGLHVNDDDGQGDSDTSSASRHRVSYSANRSSPPMTRSRRRVQRVD